jgi:hypothetical protein
MLQYTKTKRKLVLKATFIVLGVIFVFGIIYFLSSFIKENKKEISIKSLSLASRISNFLPIADDERKELEALNFLVEKLTRKDGKERSFMVFLQNNMELRPGGGFLGQYAILKIKNGEITSSYFEDANLLDQRIQAKITPPYPFTRMMQIKKWKFRDSNFSPDFPTNVEKAKYFYRLAGRSGNFDGYIAVNSDVFNDILKITGPINVPGYGVTFGGEDGASRLEEYVEKKYIMDPDLDTQNRKSIMKQMTPIIIDKLFSLGNVSKIANMAHQEFKNRNIMVNFSDPELQSKIESVHWDGKVTVDWSSDYLMMVDANMGALKTDHYIKREVSYDIDLTAERPMATLNILYKNTAPYGDWRTSDYHSYLRVYVPKGSEFLERQMTTSPITGEEFGKTYFGSIVHSLISGQTQVMIKYQLPVDFDRNNYRLLIQKQSGVGNIPVKVHLKTKDGEFTQEQILNDDLKFEFQ